QGFRQVNGVPLSDQQNGDSETQTFGYRGRICQGRHGLKNRSSADNLLNAPCRIKWQLFCSSQEPLNMSRIGIRLRNSDCELHTIVRLLRVLFKSALLMSEGTDRSINDNHIKDKQLVEEN